jgi:hypothetical protein
VKDRLGLVNVNNAMVVKLATNLIVYPGLGSDEKLEMNNKIRCGGYSFSVLFRNYIINIFENKAILKCFEMTLL